MPVITFDFDNTIAMSHMKLAGNGVEYVFDGYNTKIIELIRHHIKKGDEVHIVTARVEEKEGMFPDDTIEKHLEKLSLKKDLWPNSVWYTNDTPKREKLIELGTVIHYDDNMQEHIDAFDQKYTVRNPYDYYPDTHFVGKAIIYDSNDKILILRRTDEGKRWDIPGGHLKDIEVKRGKDGLEDGLEREVAEETGLMLPFSKLIGREKFTFKSKVSDILFYMSKFNEPEPLVNLDMQLKQENYQYKWVSMDEMFKFVRNGTQVLQNAVALAKKHGILNEEGRIRLTQEKKHSKMKKRLIGLGKNKHFGGGRGHKRPKMARSKSAPAGFGVLEEESEDKKGTIKVKIVKKVNENRLKTPKKGPNRGQNRAKNPQNRGKNKHYQGTGSSYSGGGYANSGNNGDGE